MIEDKKGNIFTTDCDYIVNTVNCVGVMGVGIAYEFRLRYPEMYEQYKILCEKNEIFPGKLWIYKSEKQKNVLNFPTKLDWKYPTKEEYLEMGLEKFVDTYAEKKIKSIAFPLLGGAHGKLTPEKSLSIMQKYLKNLEDIKIQIWHFDPKAEDDLYDKFKDVFNTIDEREISDESGLRINAVKKIKDALLHENINSISGLLKVRGIGENTLEKAFQFAINYKEPNKLF